MIAGFPYTDKRVLIVPVLLLWVNFHLCAGLEISKRSVDEITKQFIKKDHVELFSPTEELTGFEIFTQEVDKASQKTIYISLENPKFRFTHNGDDISSGESLIILDPHEDGVARKDLMITFVVLRQRKSDPKTFTSHLAYIRSMEVGINVEWDYFISDGSRRKWSFVNGFSPPGLENTIDNNRKTRQIMAAPGLVAKKAKKKSSSSSSEESAKKKKKKGKKPPAAAAAEEEGDEENDTKKKKKKGGDDEAEDEPLPPECQEEKKGRKRRKTPKVVYKININHIICANGGECKPDPCLGKGKKGKGRSMNVVHKSKSGEALFEGLGNCGKVEVHHDTTFKNAQVLADQKQMIEFILQTLRVHCIAPALPQIENLFKEKLITSDSDFHLELNKEHALYNVSAPGETEWIDMSSAMFFKIFSNTYFEEAARMSENEYHALSPNRQPISSSIKITSLLTFKTISYFPEFFDDHVYKLIKILENILQARYTENLRLRDVLQTESEKAMNLNDRIQILCLNKLINVPTVEQMLVENTFDLKDEKSMHAQIEQIFNKMYTESHAELKASAEKAA